MIVELIFGRGIQFWLDGKRPTKRWSLSELDDEAGFESDNLIVNKIKIKRVMLYDFVGSNWSWHTESGTEIIGTPRKLILSTSNGEFELSITMLACGGNVEYPTLGYIPQDQQVQVVASSISDDPNEYGGLTDEDTFDNGPIVTLLNGTREIVDEYKIYVRAELRP